MRCSKIWCLGSIEGFAKIVACFSENVIWIGQIPSRQIIFEKQNQSKMLFHTPELQKLLVDTSLLISFSKYEKCCTAHVIILNFHKNKMLFWTRHHGVFFGQKKLFHIRDHEFLQCFRKMCLLSEELHKNVVLHSASQILEFVWKMCFALKVISVTLKICKF